MRDTFAKELALLAAEDERIMFVTGDLGFGVFEEFIDRFPRQYLNVGIAEQNMIAVSTGLALEGRIVFAYSIGNFPVLRCLEQIRNDAAYHGASVKVVSVGGGFSYGSLGMSHHATEDIALMRAIPAVTSFVPGTLDDVVASTRALATTSGAGYLRLDKSQGHEAVGAEPFEVGRWRVMSEGGDVTIIGCGGVLSEAQGAAELLAQNGIFARVVDATQISGLPTKSILDAIGGNRVVLTVEEHVVRGGLGGMVAEAIAEGAQPVRLIRCGIGDSFMSQVGTQSFLRRQVGLDAATLAKKIGDELA